MPMTPTARWNAYNKQTSNAEVGVVAYSVAGIRRVEFEIGGTTYTVFGPSMNRFTKCAEYVLRHLAAPGDTIRATVYGKDGGQRTLDPLTIGQSSGKVVRVPVGKSIRDAIRAAGSGGTVALAPGNHTYDGSDSDWGKELLPVDQFVTLKGTGATVVGRKGAPLCLDYICIDGPTIGPDASGLIDGGSSDTQQRTVVFRNVGMIGDNSQAHPLGRNWRGPVWYDGCTIRDMHRAIGHGNHGPNTCVRNTTITRTREDVFQNVPFGINVTVNGVDPGTSGAHADLLQLVGSPSSGANNWIWANVRATGIVYQGLFMRAAQTDGCVLDNFHVQMQGPFPAGGGIPLHLSGKWRNLIMRGCSFKGGESQIHWESFTNPANALEWDGCLVENCEFDKLSVYKKGPYRLPAEYFKQNKIGGVMRDGF